MANSVEILEFPALGWSIELDRVAFSIGGFNFYFYGLVIACGVLLAMIYAVRNSKRFGIDSDGVFDVTIGGFVGGVIGARLYYVIFEWSQFSGDLLSIFNVRKGGLAIYGGIIGAFLCGILICKLRKVKMLPMFDLAAIGFLIGQAIGRWGNFFNIEAFGSNTNLPWGMTSVGIRGYLVGKRDELAAIGVTVDPEIPVHPCFLYESLWCLIGFIILHFVSKRRRFDGQIFLMYMGWYGLGRLFIEGLRTDSLLSGNIRISQLVAGLALAASIAVITAIFMKIRKEDSDYLELYVNTDESRELLEKAFNERIAQKNKKSDANIDDINSDLTESIDDSAKTDNPESHDENGESEQASDFYEDGEKN